MTETIHDSGDTIAEAGANLLGKILETGGRAAEGIFSSPWTGVPATLLILSQIDPSGKLTVQFLTNLGTFLTAIAKAANDVLENFAGVFNKTVLPPPPTITIGSGPFGVLIDVPPVIRTLLLLTPGGGSLEPRTDFRFATAAERDQFIIDFKNRAGAFASLYSFTAD